MEETKLHEINRKLSSKKLKVKQQLYVLYIIIVICSGLRCPYNMSDFLQNLTAIVEEASLLTTSLDDENNDKTENTQDSENSQKIDNGVEIHIHEEIIKPEVKLVENTNQSNL